MSARIESSRPSMPAAPWWRNGHPWIVYAAVLGVLSLIRGIDRIGDGHRLSGWIFVTSGVVAAIGAAWAFLQSRSGPRPQASP